MQETAPEQQDWLRKLHGDWACASTDLMNAHDTREKISGVETVGALGIEGTTTACSPLSCRAAATGPR